MRTILIKPLTPKGLVALKQHVSSTRFMDKVHMRTLGIKQAMVKDILVINLDNAATRIIEQTQPWRLNNMLKDSKEKLTKDMDKLGIVEDVDYEITF